MSMSFPYMFPPIFIRELYVFHCYIMINPHVGRSNPTSLGTPKPSFHMNSVQNASHSIESWLVKNHIFLWDYWVYIGYNIHNIQYSGMLGIL